MSLTTRLNRRLGLALALCLFAGGLAACVPQPDAGTACAWPYLSNGEVFNVAYPDAGAQYFTTKYTLTAGQTMTLSGTYPHARYMSLITYNLQGNAIDHLADTQIAPDPGSSNPFTDVAAPADPAQRRWTVTIGPDIPAGSGQSSNSLGSATVGSVILRIYVTDDPGDPTGGVPLPTMRITTPQLGGGTTIATLPQCTSRGTDAGIIDLINTFGPATDVAPSDPPLFRRPLSVSGLYPNPDNAYLAAIAAHQPGKVVVVQGLAPTTPDTRNGESPASAAQLRYWSVCTNEYRKPYPVSDCLLDHEVPLDGTGRYTLVISTPADRPANATESGGVGWLDWGSTSVNMLIGVRHMLPASGFTQSAFSLSLGQPATATMGDYAPVAHTCTTAAFESLGAAC